VTIGLLLLVATRIDFSEASDRLSGGSWGWLVAAVAALFISFLVGAWRWHVLLSAASVDSTMGDALYAYLIGVFTTNFLPSQVGGDATRAWLAGRPGNRMRAATTVVVDRATSLGCLILIAWFAYAADGRSAPQGITLALCVVTVLAAAAGLFAVLLYRGNRRTEARLPPQAVAWTRDARYSARSAVRWPTFSRTLLLGLLFQALVVLSVWCVARALAIEVRLPILAMVMPPVLMLSAAPISIGGFGVREGSYVVLLGHAGVSATDAALLSVTSALVYAVASLPGALLLIRRRGNRTSAAIESADPPAWARPPSAVASTQTDHREQEGREKDLQAGDHESRGDDR
jgi:uncharacterized membrane protein YbhN (UPF0104 family)